VDRQWRTECGGIGQVAGCCERGNERVPQNSGNILSRRGAVTFSKRTLLHEASETDGQAARFCLFRLQLAVSACPLCEGRTACVPRHRCVYVAAYVQSGYYRTGAQPVTIGRPVVFCELPDVGLQRVAREPPIATYSVR
jgi:hypothetical protein